MKKSAIGFVGGGRITQIFLHGFRNKHVEFKSVTVCENNEEKRNSLKTEFPSVVTTDSIADLRGADVVFIALHPPVIGENLLKLRDIIGNNTIIVSLAPKFNIQKLAELAGTNRIVRMIPNASSIVNLGYNPICFSEGIDSSEKASILELLGDLGNTFETEERKLEAYAIASAMLPTYFWFQWNEMEKISQEMGLTARESRETVYETLKSSLELLYHSGLNYSEVIDLIPVKPIGEDEAQIKEILNGKLLALFDKIKP